MIFPAIDGYTRQSGRHAATGSVVALPAQAFPAGATHGDWIDMGEASCVRLTLASTADSGTTPTLDVTVETTDDPTGATNVRAVGTFTQQTVAPTTERKSFGGCDRYVRLTATVGGTATPTFTASASGEVC